MKKTYTTFVLLWMGCSFLSAQEFDIVLASPESGTKTHQARNSITFGSDYSYTPSGGTMTAEIVNPVVTGDVSYNYTIVNPETRSLNTSYLVGTTSGAFSVNALGGATYTIPIDVAPGVAGLQPGLALTYNSLGGPGIAGYGWNISGISAITRSPQTYYHDGQSVGVDLTSTDRFSLDGQRLITSGTYGANGSVYRTEHDIFSKVTCYTGSYGPDRFEVKTKSGLTCQYGYDSDADQTIDGHNETVSWYVNKITDVYGNYMDFAYVKDGGYNYLAEITYGPNTVTFFYKQRSDKTISYLKGSMLEQRLILEKIEVKYNANVVKKYELKYNYPTSNYTRYSVLNEVIEYGIGSSRMNSTVFSYLTPDNVAFTQTTYNNSHDYISYKSKLCFGDFNGDGLADVFTWDDPDEDPDYSGWKLYKNNGNDSFSLLDSDVFTFLGAYSGDIYFTCTAIDLNGDNLDDILLKWYVDRGVYGGVLSDMYNFYYYISTGSSFEPYQFITTEYYPLSTMSGVKIENSILEDVKTDFNGDGLNDILILTKTGWDLYGYTYSGSTLTFDKNDSGTDTNLGYYQYFIDFNGDGKSELMAVDDNGTRILEYSSGNWDEIYSMSIPKKNHHFKLSDFNCDGKTDMFIYGYDNYDWSDWQMRLSTGTGFAINYIPKKKNNLKNDIVRVGDFNGDGCSDLMVMATEDAWNGHYYYITKNQGTDLYSHFYSGAQSSTHNYFVADFDGDGRDDYLCTDGVSPYWNGYMIYKSGTKNKIMLEKVANGLNQFTKINYKHLSEPGSPYIKGTGASFPVMDFQGALPVVSSVLSDNGRGSQNATNYAYEGAKIHRQGKGFLCYAKQTVTDAATNLKTENSFGYHAVKYFPMLTSTVNKYSSTTLSTVSNSWTYSTPATGVIFPYIYSSTQSNSQTGHSVTQTASYDSYGNPTQIVKSFNNGVTETTTNVYDNNTTNWWLGRLTSSEVEHAKSGEATISSTVTFTYSTDGKLKPDFIKYYEGTGLYYYKNHDYNSQGNLTQLYEYGNGVGSRTTTYTYETSNHVRLKTITDPLLHETEMFYDAYGRLSSEEDYLGNLTLYTYDNLGRIATETQPDGFVTTTAYNWGLTGGPTYSCYNVQQSGNDGSVTKTWYDELAREIRNDVKGFSGSYIYTATDYNTKGQLYRFSEPSTSTSPSQWNTHSYDSYGRITGITRPSGRNTTYDYDDNRVTETTGGKTSWKETDSQGLVTQAHDNGGDILYTYFPDGKVKTITAPGGAVTTMEYNDAARNQTKLIDPSAGTIEYTYNAFGQLKTQKNARNQTTTYNYHADGRISSKVTPEGTTSYSYNGNEQLTGITSPGSVSRSFGYDSKGRVNSIGENIAGSNFSTTFTYDNKGRLSTRTHPSGIVETNNFNSYGYLASISAGGATRYTITAMNARQKITAATFGTSLLGVFGFDDYGYPTHAKAHVSGTYRQDYRYSFNTVTGNLNSRQNYLRSKSESFTYDNLDRLLTGPEISMSYSANGNILAMDDLGDELHYNHPTKPYALTGFDTSSGLVPEVLQTATYTSFEQPSVITESPYEALFLYNADEQRAKMEVKQSGNTVLTRWYAGSRYIKETAGAITKEYTWIGGDAYSSPAVGVKEGANTTYYYLLRDYLGNITHLVNTSNSVVAEYTFGAWGRRRDKDTWSYTLSGEPELFAGRGFTSHEWLPWFNLYNMNGRLYDPVVGRFLSADNYVQMPDFSQSYNRYSYCLNNPLIYTDPSGEFIFTALAVLTGQLWALPITIGADFGAVTGGIRGAQDPNVGFWKGAGRGALVGGVGGGLSMIGGAGMPFVANLAIGTGSGALTGGLDAALWGNDIGEGMLWGAAAGVVFTTLTSENFSNALKGEGFYTNENVFNNMIERGMDKQAMLDYFGFEGTYTGITKGPSYIDGGGEGASFYGSTNPKTGSIKYGDLAFDSYDKLKMTYNKEMYHSLRVKNGIPLETQGTELGKHLKYYPEERLGFIHAYKNQGLYPSAGKGLMSNISYYQMQSFNLNPSQYYSAKWWHFIYKIPRRW